MTTVTKRRLCSSIREQLQLRGRQRTPSDFRFRSNVCVSVFCLFFLAGSAFGEHAMSQPRLPVPQVAHAPLRTASTTIGSEDATIGANDLGRGNPPHSMTQVVSSLAIVLGLFIGLMWVLRRTGVSPAAIPKGSHSVEILQRVPFTSGQQLHVVRFGPRVVLVAAGMSGASVLSDISVGEYHDQQLSRQDLGQASEKRLARQTTTGSMHSPSPLTQDLARARQVSR